MTIAFVTGVSGQDGSYLVDDLVADGVEVHGLIRAQEPSGEEFKLHHPGVVFHEGDLADSERLSSLIAEIAPDQIFNLGGISSVAFSWEHPELTALITGVSVATLLQAALSVQRSHDKQVRFVQASSSEIFGSPDASPQNELTPVRPVSPYGAAKAYAHHLVGVYRGQGMHASSCILYNHESIRRPETFVTRKITAGVARIAVGTQKKLVMGSLDARRDWGWAPDYVRALRLAGDNEVADDYVIATGESHTVAQFVEAAFAAVGISDWQSYIEVDPRFLRPVDVASMEGDASKIRTSLGWTPSVSFEGIVRMMVEHDVSLLAEEPPG